MKRNKLPLIKRAFGVILMSMLSFGVAKAQTAASYTFTPVTGTFTPITGGTALTVINTDEATSAAIPIGFPFKFGSNYYTQFKASSNGWITFNTAITASVAGNTSAAVTTNGPLLFPLWDDLAGSTSAASYVVTGTSPNRILTVEWLNWEWNWSATSAVISFQVKLYESTNIIEYIYRQDAAVIAGTPTASIGIGTSGTDYLSLNNATTTATASSSTFTTAVNTKPATGQVYRFAPTQCSGTPTAGSAGATVTNFTTCTGTPSLTYTGGGTESGYTFRWQSSPHNANSWTYISSASASPLFTAPSISDTTDYRVEITCLTSTGVNVSAPVVVTVTKPVVTPTTSSICLTNGQALSVAIPVGGTPVTFFTENFNAGMPSTFTYVNTSTGTTPAAAAWTQRASGYVYSGNTFVSPTGTPFALSNSDEVGSGATVNTIMTTPVINTNGYTSLTLTYNHFFQARLASYGRVEVSTNGTTWTQVANYTGVNAGAINAFANASINLNSYINQANFQIRFIYNAGWDWWWAIDDIALSGNPTQTVTWTATAGGGLPAGAGTPNTANANITVTPTSVGTFTYTATTSACGAAQPVTVTTVQGPTASFVGANDSICENTAATINVTGSPNSVITVNNGSGNFTILTDGTGNGSYTSPSLPVGDTSYRITTAQNNVCTVTVRDTLDIQVTPRPTGMLASINPSPICNGGSSTMSLVNINAYTTPATIYYSNGTSTGSYSTFFSSDNATITAPTGTYVYVIDSIVDAQGCASVAGGTSGSDTLVVNPRPSVTISSNAASVCSGAQVTNTVTLTGTAPFNFVYTNGTTADTITNYMSNTYTFTANPTTNTTYSFNSLSDAGGCAAIAADYSSTATVTIGQPASVTNPSSTATLCTGSGAAFTVSSTGLNVTYQWLENGVIINNGGVYSGANTNTLTISNVAGLNGNTYQAIANGQCGVPDTSAAATITVNNTNTWTGATSTDWNVGSNWSCGSVPVITSDVVIPNVSNDPVVMNFPTALGNTLTIASGASVTVGFGYELQLNSTITNNGGAFNLQSGKLILSGNGAQNIPAGMYLELEVNGGGVKTLDGNVMVDNMLTLTNGLIQLDNDTLTLGAPQSTMGGNANSYVRTNGLGVLKGLNMDNADSVTYHVGVTSYNPLGFRNDATTTDNFSVRVENAVYANGTSGSMVTFPAINRTWFVEEDVTGGSNVTMTPHWNIGEGINGFDNSHVYVIHHDGTKWEALHDSTLVAPAPMGTNPYYITVDSLTDFSPYSVGSGTQFPLSVKLSDITAVNAGASNKVDWKSSSEATGDKYELQSSTDGRNFTAIATRNAIGKASTYTHIDENAATGVTYYRVKMVDAEGKYAFSKVVSATVGSVRSAFGIEAYPNPVSSTVTVKVNGVMTGTASIVVTDVTGKVVKTATLENAKLDIDMSGVAPGVYFIKYSDDANHESVKINKQ